MICWMYSDRDIVTNLTTGGPFWNMADILHLELLNRSEFIRRMVGAYNAIGAMLQRSNQLLLMPENDHFEGSMHIEVKEGTRREWVTSRPPLGPSPNPTLYLPWDAWYLQSDRSPPSRGVVRTATTSYHSHYMLPWPYWWFQSDRATGKSKVSPLFKKCHLS